MTEVVAPKGLSKVEMKLLNDFTNTVNAREITGEVEIKKLVLSYDIVNGFEITYEEVVPEVVE